MAERRVVVTGLGIVSSIGNNKEEVEASLRAGRSGIVANEEYAEMGFRSRVCGALNIDLNALDNVHFFYFDKSIMLQCSKQLKMQV